jgi:1,2-diacylglycerol 3-beta-glucosyltransferase
VQRRGVTAASVALAAVNAYLLLVLAAAARARRRPAPVPPQGDPLRFTVLVPAHDEAAGIGTTLASLRGEVARREGAEVIVIADNCSDRTADVARAGGATVWQRRGGRRGKGAALEWALGRLAVERPSVDAAVLVDADCQVAPNFLAALEARLSAGADAVQVAYRVDNPTASWTAALRYASFALVNFVRPLGKAELGLSAGLFGTGMAFTREVLAAHPWTACSLLEDQEHHLSLVACGVRVAFAPETCVSSAMPTTLRRSSSQLLRWDAGRARLLQTWAPRLLASGVRARDPARLHTALETLVPPQSLLLGANALTALLAVRASASARALTVANLVGQSAFVVGGLALVRAPAAVWRALARAPALALWKLGLLVRLGIGRGPTRWVRTEREPESDAAQLVAANVGAQLRLGARRAA